jgi:hypothetical protein
VCGDHARRVVLRGPAWADAAARSGQRRRSPSGLILPHTVGRRSLEAVALGRNRLDGPGKHFSIFSFFK